MPWKECHVMDERRLAELNTPGREAPGCHPPHSLIVY